MADGSREWWRDAVIYQIYPRSFQDSDGDGVGDLPGITRRLGHVADLGADAIWLSPFFASPDKDMGYDVSDYTAVNPLFGTMADFDALVAEAHRLGLRVIIDQVLSHTSDQHPWFVESRRDRTNPKADWYVWADPRPDGTPPTNWLSVFGGPAWTFDARRRQYYLHNFLAAQPDLNFHNPAVVDALLDAMRFWLERGVDGFRLDTVNFYVHDHRLRDNPPAPWTEFPPNPYEAQEHRFSKTQDENLAILQRMRALTDRYGDIMMVGEVGEAARQIDIMALYSSGGDKLHMAYSFEFLSPDHSAAHFRSRIERFLKAAPDGWPCWSFSNHDVVRHVSRWTPPGGDTDVVARQSIALLCSFPGTLGIYQGEELGQTETDIAFHELRDLGYIAFWPELKGRDGCRTPMVWEADAPHGGFTTGTPWLPVKPPQQARAVDRQKGRAGSVLETYRAVLAFRRATPALRLGTTGFLDLPEPLLGILRQGPGGAVAALFNLSDRPAVLTTRGGLPAGPCHAAFEGTEARGTLRLPAHGWAWLAGPAPPSAQPSR
ncbi:alpha-amylase family glycosyl hydrolase [Rubellimicrobium sp. CFH 75288]|uniref:alpha-amylase family glycosyl hydrolase n=1 Tax=Rubellimicrobium sp. CFH 75288 TaxID=2697034 RepID=UPI001412D038|nr:alpha-amylase family glycosyl hydrolase [Rubellimicrobium sp. CFH 75288]NAZ35730.1 alpha-glucosidase [Rubellimicrobium sp. CFH 75288]